MTPEEIQAAMESLDSFFGSIVAPLLIVVVVFALLWVVRHPHDARRESSRNI